MGLLFELFPVFVLQFKNIPIIFLESIKFEKFISIIRENTMKKLHLIFFTVLIICSLTKTTIAQDRGLGLGIILGEPTGISGKYWLNESNAVDFGIAYSFVGSSSSASLHADYLYHLFNAIESDYILPVYYGFGGRLRTNEDSEVGLGARGVIGVALFSERYPLDFFFEIAPVFQLIPETELNFDVGIGARYFFNQK